jgi:hypothetical protein
MAQPSVRFAKIVFLLAGIHGLIVVTPLYFLEGTIARQTPPAITHPEYFYGFIGVTLAWQIAFLILSSDPVRYRPMILAAIVEKIAYGTAAVILLSEQRIPVSVFAIACVDWLLALLFSASYLKTKPSGRQA